MGAGASPAEPWDGRSPGTRPPSRTRSPARASARPRCRRRARSGRSRRLRSRSGRARAAPRRRRPSATRGRSGSAALSPGTSGATAASSSSTDRPPRRPGARPRDRARHPPHRPRAGRPRTRRGESGRSRASAVRVVEREDPGVAVARAEERDEPHQLDERLVGAERREPLLQARGRRGELGLRDVVPRIGMDPPHVLDEGIHVRGRCTRGRSAPRSSRCRRSRRRAGSATNERGRRFFVIAAPAPARGRAPRRSRLPRARPARPARPRARVSAGTACTSSTATCTVSPSDGSSTGAESPHWFGEPPLGSPTIRARVWASTTAAKLPAAENVLRPTSSTAFRAARADRPRRATSRSCCRRRR